MAAAVLLMALLMIAAEGGGTDGIRLAIRATARTSLALFLIAFSASAVQRLFPGSLGEWLLQNRRWTGLAFAFSHLVHAVLLKALLTIDPGLFWSLTNPRSVVTGAIAYGFIALMAATSLDGAVRWLGARTWKWLHSAGLWVIWVSFVFTNAKRIAVSPWYLVPVLLLVFALLLRILSRRLQRRLSPRSQPAG
ncbi:ferric reductase-like transmembrane domain-containing protein [Sandaracinobacteroides saxicola]|uniref:Ferric reductase-like transmembrane domain-containing protein n=1 Tax=Sandaracinobacteroides saxicola TaxID=2759707 RepID=A0A7G5IM19_9SPHN|nr:ferric reductase-like transmembrane domain-containing protein [Sandaracinobacteroides saxicola]QMW24411.1 ferric reductase-like transmembrane domain-containing protein [Sandaracinobacteroides saxicola]